MSDIQEQALVDKPKRRAVTGEALTETHGLARAVKDGDTEDGDKEDKNQACCVQVLSLGKTDSFLPGYCAYIFEDTDLPPEITDFIVSHKVPCLVSSDNVEQISSGDIVEINDRPGHARILHFADADDNSILLTNRCNSNCLMCPDPEGIRRGGQDVQLEWIERYLALLPRDTRHISLTGGEPTMLRDRLFTVLDMCREHLPAAEVLLISNGRMFYYKDFARQVALHGGPSLTVATALHSAVPDTHDHITGAPGSFAQTIRGIKNLLSYRVRLEVRIVVQQANYHDLLPLAELITREVRGIAQVSFMGLELLGNAAHNRDEVWLDYREVTPELSRAVLHLLRHGIVPRIYNLPLCMVDPAYWSLCAKSISYHKRTYKPECAGCAVREHCGGMFGTQLNLRLMEVRPVVEPAVSRL